MKKLIILIVIIALSIIFVGCSVGSETQIAEITETGHIVTAYGVDINIVNIENSITKYPIYDNYIVVTYKINNNRSQTYYAQPSKFDLVINGKKISYSLISSKVFDFSMFINIEPNESTIFRLAYKSNELIRDSNYKLIISQ